MMIWQKIVVYCITYMYMYYLSLYQGVREYMYIFVCI